MSTSSWPVVVVTGANGGVGFGICRRLLFQLCQTKPTDAQPQKFAPNATNIVPELPPCEGLTLIMACRSTKRAEVARTQLYDLLDAHIQTLRQRPGYDGHAHTFRKNVNIEIQYLDLAQLNSVFRFADEVSHKYRYISHLICNAGLASFSRIHWPSCLSQLLKSPMAAVTAPAFYLQHSGELSVDGLGWVWQCNLFGHYVLFRTLQHLLSASTSPLGSRVIWMSSLEASPKFYSPEDWQLKKTGHSYEGTKYQIDLLATYLDHSSLRDTPPDSIPIRHFVSQPGVCSTNVSNALAGPVLNVLKVVLFYLARWCGSPYHTITPFKAAIAAVHLSLVPLVFVTFFSPSSTDSGNKPVRFGAETDQWGEERVGLTDVEDWGTHQAEGKKLSMQCEALFQVFKTSEEAEPVYERASENM